MTRRFVPFFFFNQLVVRGVTRRLMQDIGGLRFPYFVSNLPETKVPELFTFGLKSQGILNSLFFCILAFWVLAVDCGGLCKQRCSLHSRPNLCNRACGTCCVRCKCVPPGTAGNRELCGSCYTDMTTHGNRTKCP